MSPRQSNFSFATTFAFALTIGLLSLLWLGKPTPITHAQTLPDALGSINGVVRNAQGAPLPNVQVSLLQQTYNPPIRQNTTNDQGEYVLASLPPGAYKVRFEDNAKIYATEYYDNAALWSTASDLNVSGNNLTDINAQLAPGGTISVTLEPSPSITDALLMLTLFARTATERWEMVDTVNWPDMDSELAFYGLADGRYTVCFQYTPLSDYLPSAKCYKNSLQEIYNQPPADAQEIVISGANHEDIALKLDLVNSSQLQGLVKSTSGQPLPNILVSLFDTFSAEVTSRLTNAQGRFSFSYVNDGQYTLRLTDEGNEYVTTYYENASFYTQAKFINITASSRHNLTLTMQQGGSITGTLRAEGGAILPSVSIIPIMPLKDGTWQDYNSICFWDRCPVTYEPTTGVYTITSLLAGKYRLKVSESSYQSISLSGYYGGYSLDSADDIFVTSGKPTPNIDVVLGASSFEGSISGRVMADNLPQAGITVGLFREGIELFYEPAMPFVTTKTDAQGNYHFDGLPTADYRVGFYDQTGKYALAFFGNNLAVPASVPITGTTTVDNVNVELTPGGTIRGKVLRAAGENPADFSIHIRVLSYQGLPNFGGVLPFVAVSSDADGNFELKGLPLGTYRIGVITVPRIPTPPYIHFYPFGRDESEQSNVFVRENSVVTGIDIPIDLAPSAYLPIIGSVGEVGE